MVGLLLAIVPAFHLSAQVGHDPGGSPYREILLHPAFGVAVGHLSGDRGRVGVGFSNANTIAVRYEIPSGRSMLFQFNVAYLMGDRFIVNPFADSSSAQRMTGPYESNLLMTEVGLHLRLTGSKTWRRFSPYAGVALGLLFDVHSPGDTTNSGYEFGTKVGLSGSTGVRWYPRRRRLFINAEARGQLWRLKYPSSFHATLSPDGSRVLPLNAALTDWTFHPWMSVGLGWTF
jgi:hypothetical protein